MSSRNRRITATKLRRGRDGWTLVELLVVMVILGLLVGILLPTIGFVRNRAKRIECQGRLRQIGIAMESYLASDEGRDRYPLAASLPSATPEKPSIADVLKPYAGNSAALFACPVDNEYFVVEGVSFEYRALRFAGKTRAQVLNRLSSRPRTSSEEWMMFDFDPFHGAPFQAGSRNVLFADGHVDEF